MILLDLHGLHDRHTDEVLGLWLNPGALWHLALVDPGHRSQCLCGEDLEEVPVTRREGLSNSACQEPLPVTKLPGPRRLVDRMGDAKDLAFLALYGHAHHIALLAASDALVGDGIVDDHRLARFCHLAVYAQMHGSPFFAIGGFHQWDELLSRSIEQHDRDGLCPEHRLCLIDQTQNHTLRPQMRVHYQGPLDQRVNSAGQ
mmetsp:Transcript_31001/g.84041  ORF Transcript_31001/g.84041 Transcript_31001/m.84041 type:complete len:201 (+) Transcript_31001:1119-1721(+)